MSEGALRNYRVTGLSRAGTIVIQRVDAAGRPAAAPHDSGDLPSEFGTHSLTHPEAAIVERGMRRERRPRVHREMPA